MPSYDLLIRHGAVAFEDGVRPADLGIAEGRIAAIEPELPGDAREALDATGLHVFPGVIDAHLHFNDPGRAEWEGFATGTRALAAGGTTLFYDMPLNAHPPTVTAAAFDAKLAAAQSSALVDFAFWGGIIPGNLDTLDELAARGVVGYKAFMSNSGIEDFPASDDLTLYEGMARAARLGRIVAVHAESDALTSCLAARAVAEGHTTARDYLASRPVVAELEAISRAILFAQETGCPLHIVHVSTGRGVALVAEARTRGVDVTCETCPHYLVLTGEDVERIGALAKCAPPLRSQADQDDLWRRVSSGEVAFIASDHSPAPPEMKQGGDFFAIWGGISGCQHLLGLVLDAGHFERQLPLPQLATLLAANPARRFAIPRKGRIAPGYDADLALVDLAGTTTITSDALHYRHRHTPYAGRTLRGRVVRTLVRGQTVYADGQFADAPVGRLVTPTGSQAMA
ncbi:MAG TPA: allantoinase [Ktedonobacterales bacterium]